MYKFYIAIYKMIEIFRKKWLQYTGYTEFLPLVLIGIMLATDDKFDETLLAVGMKMLIILVIVVLLYVCCSVMGFNRKVTFVAVAFLWILLIVAKRHILSPSPISE